MNDNAAADNDMDTAPSSSPASAKPDPLAAFISGGAFSRGAPAVSLGSAAASGANGSDSASAAPTAAKPDPLAAFISGGAFSKGAPTVSAAAAAAAMSAARLAPIAAATRAPDPFGDGDDGGRFCGPAPEKKEHLFDLSGLACLCCAPEGDMEMSNPALAKMMGIKGKLGGGGGGGRGQFDF